MTTESREVEVNTSEAPKKKTSNTETPEEFLEWAQSFHHETPPMFRRRFEDVGEPKPSVKAAHKLVDYDSDSEEGSADGGAPEIPTANAPSPTSPCLSICSTTARQQAVGQPTSVASDSGPDRDLRVAEGQHPEKTTAIDLASVSKHSLTEHTREASTNKLRLNFAGPAYPTVLQPLLPDLTHLNDPNGIAARRLAKYQSFNADEGLLQTHLHSIVEQHFGPRFHTRFFIKTIGTIMCDQCKQKNNGEIYKCHTCTNQICRTCVEDRLQREEDERKYPPSHGEGPYEWEWNGKDRHEGFKLCYLERKEKSTGQGDYSIPFVGVVDGKDVIEGKIDMIVSDVQGGRKRKEPPVALGLEKAKHYALKDDSGLPTRLNRTLGMENERVQKLVLGKDSATPAKLSRIEEAAQVASSNGKGADRKSTQARSVSTKRSHSQHIETFAREKQHEAEYDRLMLQAQMLPAVALDYGFPLQQHIRIPAAAANSAYTAGSIEYSQRGGYVTPSWDGRGLLPYKYHPHGDVNRQYDVARPPMATEEQTRGNQDMVSIPCPAPGMTFDANGQTHLAGYVPASWNAYGQPYLPTDAERFQAQVHVQQLQAQAAAMHQMHAQDKPIHAAGAEDTDRSRVPGPLRNRFEFMSGGSPYQAAAKRLSLKSADGRPYEVAKTRLARPRRRSADATQTDEAPAETIDPSSMLPDDPTIFIPQQYRTRSGGGYTRWDALINAANVMYQLDLNKLDGMAVGELSPAQVDAVRQAAKQGQQQSREQVARKARECAAAGDAVVIDDDDAIKDQDNARDTASEKGLHNMVGVAWEELDVDGGRLRSGKEFTS